MRLCLSVYISFPVLRRTLAISNNIILCWFCRTSHNIFGPPQNCSDFPGSHFVSLTKCWFSLISFCSIKDFKQERRQCDILIGGAARTSGKISHILLCKIYKSNKISKRKTKRNAVSRQSCHVRDAWSNGVTFFL